jgi:two-component system, NarL family, sensor histidine kinase YdfH
MMNKSLLSRQKLDQDPRLFMWFMTLVIVIVYVITLLDNVSLRSPGYLALFTALIVIHILLHWMLVNIVDCPRWVLAYIAGQGLLAFVLCWMANSAGMVFALYMALIGEIIGLLKITRQGILAVVYFLSLSSVNLALLFGWSSALWWVLAMVPMVIWVGIYVLLYVRQLEAREKAQVLATELETANRELSDYAARVEDLTIAAERQRMARELHDTLSQGLAGLILQLEAADAHLASNRPEKARAIVQQTMQRARSTLSDARRAIGDLRQNGQAGLEELLQLEISHFTEETGIPCDFQFDLAQPVCDTSRETAIRATSEALTNIARHSQAGKAFVNATSTETNLEITITDNGKGFDPSNIPAGHYGILGIKERVRLIGGMFDIESSPEKGTTLSVKIPLMV